VAHVAVTERPIAGARRAYREMALAAVTWGTIGPAVAIAGAHTSLSALQISFWRLAIAAVPLALLALVAVRATRLPSPRVLASGLVVGALTGTSQLTYFAAVTDAGIAIPTLIAAGLGPILTALGQATLFRAPDARTLGALAVALAGLALLVLDGPSEVTTRGVLLAIVTACTYAAATLAAGPVGRRMDVTVMNATATATVGGVLALLPFVLLAGGPGLAGSAAGWLTLLYLGLVVSWLAYSLYFSAARHLPATHISVLTLLEPLVAAVIATALFGETLTAGAVLGGLLLLGAVVALRDREVSSPRPAAPT
jgi:DME family drug/metabolite transporter